MAGFDVWDVVKVPFPYTNRPVRQHRPALVVAQHSQADSPDPLWVLIISSGQQRRWVGDVDVSDMGAAGLPAPSIVRTAKIATIEAAEAAKLGALPLSDRPAVRGHLACLFAPAMAG